MEIEAMEIEAMEMETRKIDTREMETKKMETMKIEVRKSRHGIRKIIRIITRKKLKVLCFRLLFVFFLTSSLFVPSNSAH